MPDRWPGRPTVTWANPALFQGLWICPLTPSLSPFSPLCVCLCVCVGFRQTSCLPGHSTSLQAGQRPTCGGQNYLNMFAPELARISDRALPCCTFCSGILNSEQRKRNLGKCSRRAAKQAAECDETICFPLYLVSFLCVFTTLPVSHRVSLDSLPNR